jgi:biuret amidohydrolase
VQAWGTDTTTRGGDEVDAPAMLIGQTVLIVVDIQRGYGMPADEMGIELMGGQLEMIGRAEEIVGAARSAGIPIVFFQEVHRRDGVDFGRELDGNEGVHCVEGDPGTDYWPTLVPGPGEYGIAKRRYSCFFGTDLEILLKGLGASTLVLIGGLTDVCIHYTFADGHQHDYRMRVISDCVIGSSAARHAASLSAMEYLQHGAVRTTSEFLEALAELDASQETALAEKGAA